ncbi:DUF4149 domain-containing protein [Xenophilus sp. Marseille-Q4582]|uniref:DUF4149 domain-containing protein n=1 Tax=Xenophilus sp. Marseille-Q4582 TaxID=2866600 RepID=UPI001CE40C64|nr:DUF4149 domain-containing protein [Xenophilus sp. Marseille-Q4582]
MKQRLALMSAALWWGSLTVIGFVAVPMLFAHLATPAMAGAMAARLFTAQSWMSVGCALVLLMATTRRDTDADDAPSAPPPAVVMPVVAGLLLALLLEYAVAPRIVARENLKLWHSVGTGMYFVQWLCAGAVLWRLGHAKPR